jgi:hypothetical protein
MEETPLGVSGVCLGREMRAHNVRMERGKHGIRVGVRIPSLELGLRIHRADQRDAQTAFYGEDETRVGDGDELVVVARDDRRTSKLLTEDLQHELLRVHENVGSLTVTDDELSLVLEGAEPNPELILDATAQLSRLAMLLGSEQNVASSRGPYR